MTTPPTRTREPAVRPTPTPTADPLRLFAMAERRAIRLGILAPEQAIYLTRCRTLYPEEFADAPVCNDTTR